MCGYNCSPTTKRWCYLSLLIIRFSLKTLTLPVCADRVCLAKIAAGQKY
jgi:hypothetical protein